MPQIYNGKERNFAKIDVAAGATAEIVAAVSGRRIVVTGLVLSADTAGTVKVVEETGGTPADLTGTMTTSAAPVQLGNGDAPLLETTAGKNLGLTTVTNTIDGWVIYYLD